MMRNLARIAILSMVVCGAAFAVELRVPEQHASIQAALDAAAAGDVVTVGEGIYDENLAAKTPVTILGAGAALTTVRGSAFRGPVMNVGPVSGVVVKGLRLLMVDVRKLDANAAKPSVVSVSTGGGLVMEGVEVENGADCGLLSEGGSVTLRDCKVQTSRGHGVSLAGQDSWGHFSGCTFFRNGGMGVSVMGHADAEFEACVSKENALRGYIAGEGARFQAHESSAVDNKGAGMVAEYAALFSVKGCRVLRNAAGGISLSGGDTDSIVEENLCEENPRYGIYLDDAAKARVAGNRIRKNGGAGITVAFIDTSPLIVNNACEGNQGDGIVVMQGASPRLEGNRCTGNSQNGILVTGWDTTASLVENDSNQNGMNGVFVDHTAIARLSKNRISGNKGQGLLVQVEGRADSDADEISENGGGDHGTFEEKKMFFVFKENEVSWCLATGRFARLERLREHFLEAPVRVTYGYYGLGKFYEALFRARPGFGLEFPDKVVARIDEWATAFPESAFPEIARMLFHESLAWKARGTGYSNTVAANGWKVFGAEIDRALEVLKRIEARGDIKDPEFYVTKIGLLIASSAPKEERLAALKAGIPIQPGYAPLYGTYLNGLLPRWGGSASAISNFLPQVKEFAGPEDGPIVYGRLVNELLQYEDLADLHAGRYGIEWDFACIGLAQINRDHPDNIPIMNSWAFSACMEKDQVQARRAFARVADLYSQYVWRNRRNFDAYKAWATGAAEYPSGPVGPTGQVTK